MRGGSAQGFEHGAADQMLQLADIAGPGVAQQCGLCAGIEPQAAELQARAVFFEKVAGQHQRVAVALAQRRHGERVDAQPVVEIGAHAAGAHFGGQVAVGGGDHAHIHLVFAVGAQALQLATLQHAQELGLHGQRELAHFVEEQGAVVGLLEFAAPLGQRASEGAAHMAEQLALDQVVGQGRAVDADQRLAGAARLRVHGLRHQLFAGAGFAGDQHAQIAGCHQRNVFVQLAHGRAGAQNLAFAAGAWQGFCRAAHIRQLLHALGRGYRSGGQVAESLQHLQRIAVGKAVGLERVERQQAPGETAGLQHAAHAVVHVQLAGQGDQAVVGIG